MKSLRRRLTFTHTMVALLAVVLVALLAGALISRAFDVFAAQQRRVAGQALSLMLAQFYVRNRGWNNVELVLRERLAEQRLAPVRMQRVLLAETDWRVIFDSGGQLEGQPLPRRLRPQSVAVMAGGRVVGYVALPIGSESFSEEERQFLRSIANIVVVGSLVSGAVALIVALLVARRLTRPLRSLTLAAQRLAAGERHQPIALPADTELAELALAFNTMAAELAHQQELRRQLVADIAHELRTPLTVLHLQVESLEDGIEPATPATLASLGHEVSLLTRLVEDLRLISLADAGQLSLAPQPLDAHALLERAAVAAAPRARQQGIDLRVEGNEALPAVCADPQRLAQVIGNLVENALRYTPSGGRVTLRASRQSPGASCQAPGASLEPTATGDWLALEVSDTGPGIAPTDLPHIFDRFYRADRARARETGGSGLGLAIVQRLVEAQGGRITVASTPGQGTTFRVLLPIA